MEYICIPLIHVMKCLRRGSRIQCFIDSISSWKTIPKTKRNANKQVFATLRPQPNNGGAVLLLQEAHRRRRKRREGQGQGREGPAGVLAPARGQGREEQQHFVVREHHHLHERNTLPWRSLSLWGLSAPVSPESGCVGGSQLF